MPKLTWLVLAFSRKPKIWRSTHHFNLLSGVAFSIQSLFIFAAALVPVEALSKVLKDRYAGDAPSMSLYGASAVVETGPERFGWHHRSFGVALPNRRRRISILR